MANTTGLVLRDSGLPIKKETACLVLERIRFLAMLRKKIRQEPANTDNFVKDCR